MYEIRNRFTDEVTATAERGEASFYCADLRDASLCDASLCDADLRDADLRDPNRFWDGRWAC